MVTQWLNIGPRIEKLSKIDEFITTKILLRGKGSFSNKRKMIAYNNHGFKSS